ncbi:MAG TPA: TetR/AcrR family transcriptional regulator [Dehalococcoidia bacterium]|nr:TetR/AcrR family transcriptional regulator [Dehalococcoidia bacterium]
MQLKARDTASIDEKRLGIAQKAAALFIKQGYLKTTVRQICHECNLSMGGLYYYMSSKDDILSLFQEVAFSSLTSLVDLIEERLSTMGRATPRETLSLAIEKYLSVVDEVQDFIVFWYQEWKNLPPSRREYLFRQEEICADLFKGPLIKGCGTGEFKIEMRLADHAITVLCDMWAFRRWALKKEYTLEQYTKELTDFILGGVSCN